jgi:hypothetical protein
MGNNNCSVEVQQLVNGNVMNSKPDDDFKLADNILVLCFGSMGDMYGRFCLFPPTSLMPNMCRFPIGYDPTFLFSRMNETELTDTTQLPRVISFAQLQPELSPENRNVWVANDLVDINKQVMQHIRNVTLLATSDVIPDSNTIITLCQIGQDQVQMTSIVPEEQNKFLRPAPGIPQSIDVFRAVAVNSQGTLRAVLSSTQGLYIFRDGVDTSFILANDLATVIPPLTTTYVSLLMWEEIPGTTTRLAVGFQTLTTVQVYLYEYNSELKTLSCYNANASITLTASNNFSFMLKEGVGSTLLLGMLSLTQNVSQDVQTTLFTLDTNSASSTFVQKGYLVAAQDSVELRKWDAITTPQTLATGSKVYLFDRQTHLLVTFTYKDDSSEITLWLRQNTPGVVLLSDAKKGMNAYGILTQANAQQIVAEGSTTLAGADVPFVPTDVADCFAVSPDGTKINAIPNADGLFYQFDVATLTWSTQSQFFMYSSTQPAVLQESKYSTDFTNYPPYTNHSEWFLGFSYNTNGEIKVYNPQGTSDDNVVFVSRHSIVRLVQTDYGVFRVEEINLPTLLIDNNLQRDLKVRMCNNGNVQVVDLWTSYTDDQQGGQEDFNVLLYPLDAIAPGTIGSVSSPNGIYMLLLYENSIDLVINPYNTPRYTKFTSETNSLDTALAAQSKFCFEVLNNPNSDNPLAFADNRCLCLSSSRLAQRVYNPQTIETVPVARKKRLVDQLPCILSNCQVETNEYSNVAFGIGQKCLAATGICATQVTPGIQNFIIQKNCSLLSQPCAQDNDCPQNTQCKLGQCQPNCTTDAECQAANPNARCLNGNCTLIQPAATQQQATQLSVFTIVAVVLAVLFLIILCLTVFFGVAARKSSPPVHSAPRMS